MIAVILHEIRRVIGPECSRHLLKQSYSKLERIVI